MVSLSTPVCDFGWKAPDFSLPGVDGKNWTLADAMGPNGLLVMFICNHCPYVKAIRARLVRDINELKQNGIHAIAVMSNDATDYAEDSFENMQSVARELSFPFPYVLDETQQVAEVGADQEGRGTRRRHPHAAARQEFAPRFFRSSILLL